jgi:hypothetical protein
MKHVDGMGQRVYRSPKRTVCTVGGCCEPIHARSFCNTHYHNYKRWQNPLTSAREIATEIGYDVYQQWGIQCVQFDQRFQNWYRAALRARENRQIVVTLADWCEDCDDRNDPDCMVQRAAGRCAKVHLLASDAAQWFASRTQDILEVLIVALAGDTLWTILSTEERNTRHEVYQIEQALQRFMYKPLVRFRVLSVSGMSDPIESVLPSDAQVLFSRSIESKLHA